MSLDRICQDISSWMKRTDRGTTSMRLKFKWMNGLWSNLSVIVGQPTSHPQTGSDTPRGRSKRRRQANMLCKSSQCSDQDLAPHAIPWLDGQKPTANGRATVATLSWNCVGTWICLVENLDQNTWTWILIDIPCYIMFQSILYMLVEYPVGWCAKLLEKGPSPQWMQLPNQLQCLGVSVIFLMWWQLWQKWIMTRVLTNKDTTQKNSVSTEW